MPRAFRVPARDRQVLARARRRLALAHDSLTAGAIAARPHRRYGAPAMAPLLATVFILAGLAVFAWTISYRIRPLLFGRGDVRWDDPAARTEKLLAYGIGQKRMPAKPERPAGMAHIWIFVAFLVAQLGTLPSFGLAYDPGFHLPLLSHDSSLGQGYLFVKDLIDLLGTAGCAVFLYFRIV